MVSLTLAAFGTRALAAAQIDGSHDFDFAIGTFKTHIMTIRPGKSNWQTIDGIVTTRTILHGKGNLEEIEATTPTARFEAMTLRMYEPQAKQWALYSANSRDGKLDQPLRGRFVGGRGVFYDREVIDGQPALVRNTYFAVTPSSYRFEQSFSNDGGKSWRKNFVAALTRIWSPKRIG